MSRSILLRFLLRSAIAGVVTISAFLALAQTPAADAPRIQANSNQVPAGQLANGVLTLHLELRSGKWYPEADDGPNMSVYAFAEAGKPPQVPGPLIRVAQGTEVRVTLHSLLSAPAVVHGLHEHPGDPSQAVTVAPGETREVSFSAGSPGTYQYWASAGGPMNRGRPYKEDSQLGGGFIVDPPGDVPPDRVFVIGLWRSRMPPALAREVPVINGKSWPYTERLTYSAGEPVRWRWINASDAFHPMHMHGSYYRVDSDGDGEQDQIYEPEMRPMVVTHVLRPGTTMTTFWNPPAGRWIFHCHILAHLSPENNITNALAKPSQPVHQHGSNHMGGLVLGITVTGERPAVASHGRPRKLRLLVRERPAGGALPAGFGYQLEEAHKRIPDQPSSPGPALVLEKGRPVEITVVNQLREPTAVHWHGIELESYYDGVTGWGTLGDKVTPSIAPGGSFCARFTPPRAGTFIYHTHLNDEMQMSSGLYGPIVVLEPGEKFDAAADHIFVFSLGDADELRAQRVVNGTTDPPAMNWQAGRTHRLRLVDITPNNAAVFTLVDGQGVVKWRSVAKDGADLPPAQVKMMDAQQTLFSGETYDFEFEALHPESLRLEVENVPTAPLHWKVIQRIEVQ